VSNIIPGIELITLWLLLFSPFAGSFIGTVILSLPEEQDFLWRRSSCPHCQTQLKAGDLVPILSYFFLRGKCRYCGAPVAPFYLHIELAAMLVAASALLAPGHAAPSYPILILIGWWLLALAVIDWQHFLLPDVLTFPLIGAGLAFAAWQDMGTFPDYLIGAVAGYLSLFLIAKGYNAVRGIDGLGLGDAKLFAAIGAWLGWTNLPLTLLIASTLALIGAGIGGRVSGDFNRMTRIPLGTYLCLAFWIMLLCRYEILAIIH